MEQLWVEGRCYDDDRDLEKVVVDRGGSDSVPSDSSSDSINQICEGASKNC